MTGSTATSSDKAFRMFTAIDLVTLAVFAALYRALWYVWHALNFLWPWNNMLNTLFMVLCGVAAAVIVRKFGALSLYVLASMLINMLLQGETLVVVILFLTWGIVGDIYIYFRLRAGSDPFSNRGDMVVAGVLMALLFVITLIWIGFPFIWDVDISLGLSIGFSIACMAGGVFGAWIGYGLGAKLRPLIS